MNIIQDKLSKRHTTDETSDSSVTKVLKLHLFFPATWLICSLKIHRLTLCSLLILLLVVQLWRSCLEMISQSLTTILQQQKCLTTWYLYWKTPTVLNWYSSTRGNCEEELPEKPVGRLSVVCWPTVGRLLADCRPSVGRLSAVCRPTVDRLSAVCRPTDGRQVFPKT